MPPARCLPEFRTASHLLQQFNPDFLISKCVRNLCARCSARRVPLLVARAPRLVLDPVLDASMNALLRQPAIEVPQKRLAAHRTACISLPMLGRTMSAAAQPGGLRCDASRKAVTAAPATASKGKQVVQHVAEPTTPATPPLFSQQTASAVVCMLTAYHLVLFAAVSAEGAGVCLQSHAASCPAGTVVPHKLQCSATNHR